MKIQEENRVLVELWLGILGFCFLSELIGILFVKNRISYSIGILVGCITAFVMAYHMYISLIRGLALEQSEAEKYIRKRSVIRYITVALFMGIVMLLGKWINPLSWFLALMGLKVAAYIQPVIHRIILGKDGIEEERIAEAKLQEEYALLHPYDEENEEDL